MFGDMAIWAWIKWAWNAFGQWTRASALLELLGWREWLLQGVAAAMIYAAASLGAGWRWPAAALLACVAFLLSSAGNYYRKRAGLMDKKVSNDGPGSNGINSPNVNQRGRVNIAQIGDHNRATVVDRERLALDQAQQDAITAAVADFRGQRIKLQLDHSTTETEDFADALRTALDRAGIQIVATNRVHVFGAIPSGITFIVPNDKPSELEFVKALASGLVRAGVPFKDGKVPLKKEGGEMVVLNIKPL
jgi:hypothetical protein